MDKFLNYADISGFNEQIWIYLDLNNRIEKAV